MLDMYTSITRQFFWFHYFESCFHPLYKVLLLRSYMHDIWCYIWQISLLYFLFHTISLFIIYLFIGMIFKNSTIIVISATHEYDVCKSVVIWVDHGHRYCRGFLISRVDIVSHIEAWQVDTDTITNTAYTCHYMHKQVVGKCDLLFVIFFTKRNILLFSFFQVCEYIKMLIEYSWAFNSQCQAFSIVYNFLVVL